MGEKIEKIYRHIMDNKILKNDRYDIIMISNYWSSQRCLSEVLEMMLDKLWNKYQKQLCIDSIQT